MRTDAPRYRNRRTTVCNCAAESGAHQSRSRRKPGARALVDPVHAAIAVTGAEAERIKSAPDIEFLVDRAVDGVVLDLGCGYGRVAKYLLPVRRFDGYVGIDGSLTMLELFLERYRSRTVEQATPILLMHGSIEQIKLPSASVDNVVISAVLLHNSKRSTRAVLSEAREECSVLVADSLC